MKDVVRHTIHHNSRITPERALIVTDGLSGGRKGLGGGWLEPGASTYG